MVEIWAAVLLSHLLFARFLLPVDVKNWYLVYWTRHSGALAPGAARTVQRTLLCVVMRWLEIATTEKERTNMDMPKRKARHVRSGEHRWSWLARIGA
jgi:hypothetical protein